jgi:hypothetical protein
MPASTKRPAGVTRRRGGKPKSREMTEVDIYVSHLPLPHQEFVQQLRDFIHQKYPELMEALKWKAAVYSLNGTSYLLGIQAFKRHVNLDFFQGAKLYNPHGILKGTGKLVRHVTFRTIEDIRYSRIQALIDQTIAVERVSKAREKKS